MWMGWSLVSSLSKEVVVTGHSLGGGIALVVGALTDRLAVAIQPPGAGEVDVSSLPPK